MTLVSRKSIIIFTPADHLPFLKDLVHTQLAEMLDFAAKHNIRPWVEKRPFEEVNEAFKDVHAGKPRYRIVLETDAAKTASL